MPLVVISGCDGAGKSSLARALEGHESTYKLAHWTTFARTLRLEDDAATLIGSMKPATRAHFLLLLNWGLREHVIENMLSPENIVLCESYYFKFLAKERLYGRSDPRLIEELRLLPPPDAIIDVVVPPHLAFKRRVSTLNEYETLTGLQDQDDFCNFQAGIRLELDRIISSLAIPVLTLDGREPVNTNAALAHHWIRQGHGSVRVEE
jgi:thymidylate kinase